MVAFSEIGFFLVARSGAFFIPTESFGSELTCNVDLDLVRVKTPEAKDIVAANIWIYFALSLWSFQLGSFPRNVTKYLTGGSVEVKLRYQNNKVYVGLD